MTARFTELSRLVLTGAVSMLLATGICAHAAQRNFEQPPEKTVDFGDLNRDSGPGARAALRRIERAARDVCGGAHQVREVSERVKYRQCVETTTARTVRKLNAPLVTALYNKRKEHKRLADRGNQNTK